MNKPKNLKVRFSEPLHGWIEIQLQAVEEKLSLAISYTPYHFIEELIEATIKVLDGEDAKANGSYNPERYEFLFNVEEELAHLQVLEFPDHKQNENFRKVLFEHTGKRLELCKSFWRGFKDLQGKISPEDFEKSFRREFPVRDLEFLTGKISQVKF